jgi:hypothetical protein
MEPAQMPQEQHRARAVLLNTILVLSTLLSGLFFEPELVSTYWHPRYGGSTTFHGWTVLVPRGWSPATGDDQLILNKMLRFYDHRDVPSIILGTLVPRKPIDPEVLKDALIHTIVNEGYVFQETRLIHIGAHPAYCVHFASAKDPEWIRINCESLAAQLSLDLFGWHSEIQDFYSVVGQLKKPEDTPATGPAIGSKIEAEQSDSGSYSPLEGAMWGESTEPGRDGKLPLL